jgi:hypothetical protein
MRCLSWAKHLMRAPKCVLFRISGQTVSRVFPTRPNSGLAEGYLEASFLKGAARSASLHARFSQDHVRGIAHACT